MMDSMPGTPSTTKRIYVSRRTWTREKSNNIGTDYTNQRRCVNEDRLVEMLKDYGFEEVFCEDLNMEEKIGLFRNAEFVIGPIGGGLSNVLFCKPGTNVISINSPEFFPTNERLKYALNHTNLIMFDDTEFVDRKKDVITGTNALSISGGMNSPWRVDITKLRKYLDKR
jgi:capsular polysaccharide biosynthesis protein